MVSNSQHLFLLVEQRFFFSAVLCQVEYRINSLKLQKTEYKFFLRFDGVKIFSISYFLFQAINILYIFYILFSFVHFFYTLNFFYMTSMRFFSKRFAYIGWHVKCMGFLEMTERARNRKLSTLLVNHNRVHHDLILINELFKFYVGLNLLSYFAFGIVIMFVVLLDIDWRSLYFRNLVCKT